MISGREQFCAVLATGQLLAADAVVLLAGEDGIARCDFALELLRRGGAPKVLITGGRDEPTAIVGAERLQGRMLGKGYLPGRIIVDETAMNTRQQAEVIANMADAERWSRILLVASPYHQYRAFLTVLKALDEIERAEAVHVISVAASQAPWFQSPEGCTSTRLSLLATEFAKIDEYSAKGHVATYERGLDYLKFWEAKVRE